MENDETLKTFNEIVEFNEFEFIDINDEVDTETSESEYDMHEAMELNYMLATVMQQLTAAQIDMENDEKTGWLDIDSAILLRELYEICEQVIDRTYDDCDECDECDGDG